MTAVALAVALDLICAQPVDAYLDPGTGSYVFQLLIAGLVGVLFLVKVYWRRITAVCGRLFHKSGDDASARDERSTSDEEQCE